MQRVGRQRWGPCPRCGRDRTTRDDRPPVLLSDRGWYCLACKTGGETDLSLASWAVAGQSTPTKEVHEFVSGGARDAPPKVVAPPAPRRADVSDAIRMAKPISQVEDEKLDAWLKLRCIHKSAPAGWLPDFTAPWWPAGNSGHWPVIIPACTGRGVVESIHGVSIGDAPRKTQWPAGVESRELLFATPATREWLRGNAPAPARVLVVEGATDFLSSVTRLDDCAVIGVSSGAAKALYLAPKTKGQRWYVGTDPDTSGDKYAKEVADAIFPTPVYPIPLRKL